MAIKKFTSVFILITAVLASSTFAIAQDSPRNTVPEGNNIVDDSIRDMSIVLGTGVVGAVLGLSTLSFVETPSEHTKNIAVGGAVGIVIGVGIVIFSQATKNSTSVGEIPSSIPMNSKKFETLSKQEFKESQIAKNYFQEPTVGYNFSF